MGRDFLYQNSKKIFNNDKCVTQIVKSGKVNNSWVISGYHALNGNSAFKWNQVNTFMGEIND